ncbi:hypothetical protein [Arthrobacter sp. ov407]|uniref:hypothetical protein n=1 Tax=Arthrobacter sp. ov407 TaxID=1761748 RepID=UPI00115FDC3A|nr:hypothetical protein [Arthrobacter sp. ov407]
MKTAGLWLLLVLLLLVTAWILLTLPKSPGDGGIAAFMGELGSAILGAAVNAATALVITFYALSARIRRRRRDRIMASIRRKAEHGRALVLGEMSIPGIIPVASFGNDPSSTHVRFEFAPMDTNPPRVPEEWQLLRDGRLQQLVAKAAASSVVFTDDEAVDIVAAGVVKTARSRTDGETVYQLVPRRTSYFLWAATSAQLDRELTEDEKISVKGHGATLRDRWGKWPTRLEDLNGLPAPAKLGCGVVVVTQDNYMVLGLRGRTFVASDFDADVSETRDSVHFVAEGVLPTDLDAKHVVNPDVAAFRGLREELAVGNDVGSLARITSLRRTGVFLDTERWQPCFAYLAKVDVTFDELNTLVLSARDFWEADRLVPVLFDPFDDKVKSMMLDVDTEHRFASNHAHALAYFALLSEFGLPELRDSLQNRKGLFPDKRARGATGAAREHSAESRR